MESKVIPSVSRRGVHLDISRNMRTLLPKPSEAGDASSYSAQKPSDDTHRTWVKIKRIAESNEGFEEGDNEGLWIQIERIPKEEGYTKDNNAKSKQWSTTCATLAGTSTTAPAKTGRRRIQTSLYQPFEKNQQTGSQSQGRVGVVKGAGLNEAVKKQSPKAKDQPKRAGRKVRITPKQQDEQPLTSTSSVPLVSLLNKVKTREKNSQLEQQPVVRMTRLSIMNQENPQYSPKRTRAQKRKVDNLEACVSPSLRSSSTKDAAIKQHSAVYGLDVTQSVDELAEPVPRKKKASLEKKVKKPEVNSELLTLQLTLNQDALARWQALAQDHQFTNSELAEFLVSEQSHLSPRETWSTSSISISPSADTYNKWQTTAQERNCTDSELAAFLLKFYKENTKGMPCERCKILMSRYWHCIKCYNLVDTQHKDGQTDSNKDNIPELQQQETKPVQNSPTPVTKKKVLLDSNSSKSKGHIPIAPLPSKEQNSDCDWEDNDIPNVSEEPAKDDLGNQIDYTNVLQELVERDLQPMFFGEEEQVAGISDQHKCQVCDRTFTDPEELSAHLKNAQHDTKDDPLHCKLCDKTFVDPDQFTYHLAKHRNDMHHECTICQARFFKAEILVLHAKFHEEDTQFYCDQCNAAFLTKRALALHQQWQVCEEMLALQERSQPKNLPGTEQFRNESYGARDDYGFLNNETLVEETFTPRSKQTRKRRYFPKRDKWQCHQCGASFVTGRQLERHSSVHSGVKKYGCQICGASFPQNCSLVAHMKSHSNFKPYECGECHKTFKYARFLRFHTCKPEAKSQAKSAHIGESKKTGGKESQSPESAAGSKPIKNNPDETEQPALSASTGSSEDVSVRPVARFMLMQLPVKNESGNEDKPVSLIALPGTTSLNDSSLSETYIQENQQQLSASSKYADDTRAQNTTHPPSAFIKSEKGLGRGVVSKPKRPYQCSYCKACFHFPSHLSQHMHRHTGKNAFHCSECDQSFKFIYSYTRHMNEHKELGPGVPLRSGPRPPNIPRIDRAGFITHGNMRIKPLAKTHPDQRALYQCPYCEKQTTRYQLVQHLRVHTGEKPFTCEVCGKSFTRMETYRKHRVIHNTDKPHMCPECGKRFRTKSYLTQHVKGHTNKVLRPFICEYCNKSYHSGRYLKEHIMVVHAGQRQGRSQQFSHVVCEICGKRVTRPYLKIHMRTHSGEKPYLCGSCSACFVSSTQLKVHQRRRHTGEKPYQCEFCGKRFVQSFERRYHYRRHHKTQTASPAVYYTFQ